MCNKIHEVDRKSNGFLIGRRLMFKKLIQKERYQEAPKQEYL